MDQSITQGSEEFSGHNFINNIFVQPKSGKVYERTNPVDGSKIGVFADSSPQDAEMAITAAAEAFKSWSKTSYDFRADLLVKLSKSMAKHVDEIAQAMTNEVGKVITESIFEAKTSSNVLVWFAYETKRVHGQFLNVRGKKKLLVNHKPHGVVVLITMYHAPLCSIIASLGALLGAGCTVVIKPSPEVPLSAIKVAMAGFPPGVVNVVTADFASTPALGSLLCTHPQVRHVSFTGSMDVGKVYPNMNKANYGKNSLNYETMHNDDEWECTSNRCCDSPNRIFVQKDVHDEFIRILIERLSAVKVGHPMDESSILSCLVDQSRFDRVVKIVELTIKQGGKLAYQGDKVSQCGPYYYPLTVLTECKTSMDIAQFEIFGPVFAIYKFEHEAEVFLQMNEGPYGLASYVYSEEIDQVLRTIEEMECGLVFVNDIHPFEHRLPFSGMKQSGIGSEMGPRSIYRFLDEQSVIINHE
ncbi:putative succinate-semialdehyde dehydrogenase [NADP(+)] [Thelohanellus kitauei]|uniref:Putative succinate-semialdehyde dehydrogenase [NADP(+)] n=1 Tax=Thelohanellus kitauei TaxID=669202 RepID=A0A0C2MHW9_THEKT|nr:putative succinate-semialdehyde dehydrogenase [NADP(+)] [Thelohanellus kitauei]